MLTCGSITDDEGVLLICSVNGAESSSDLDSSTIGADLLSSSALRCMMSSKATLDGLLLGF